MKSTGNFIEIKSKLVKFPGKIKIVQFSRQLRKLSTQKKLDESFQNCKLQNSMQIAKLAKNANCKSSLTHCFPGQELEISCQLHHPET